MISSSKLLIHTALLFLFGFSPLSSSAEEPALQAVKLASATPEAGMVNNRSFVKTTNISDNLLSRLLHQLQAGSAAERTCAATDLGFLRARKAELQEFLVNALRTDESKWVRRAAAKSLGRLGLRGAIEPLTEALSDPDQWVAHSANNALRSLNLR